MSTTTLSRAVASLAGDDEPLTDMREGSRALDRAGIMSQHWTIPGAFHGGYAADGARLLGEAVHFVAEP